MTGKRTPQRRKRGAPADPQVHGILNIWKLPGTTSMDIVRQVKRLTRQRHVGHGGTLDPLAEGVLPVFFGKATRLMEFLVDAPKVYAARVRLGVTTDTYDADGVQTGARDPSGITREQVEQSLQGFMGPVHQVPPMYSALKRQGQRLYDLARLGVEVERAPRKVQVNRLDLLEWTPPELELAIECGRGLYIRSLAHDLGESLGCGAHLVALTRQRSGPFDRHNATTLEEVGAAENWESLLQAPDFVVSHLDAAVVGPGLEQAVKQGRQIRLGPGRIYPPPVEPCRLYTTDGRFLGLARYSLIQGTWQPDKVLDLESKG